MCKVKVRFGIKVTTKVPGPCLSLCYKLSSTSDVLYDSLSKLIQLIHPQVGNIMHITSEGNCKLTLSDVTNPINEYCISDEVQKEIANTKQTKESKERWVFWVLKFFFGKYGVFKSVFYSRGCHIIIGIGTGEGEGWGALAPSQKCGGLKYASAPQDPRAKTPFVSLL